jgi:hypothetical protein
MDSIVGQRFGSLVVLGESHKKHSHTYWRCKCDCGKEHTTENNRLRRGAVKSCGCLRSAHADQINSSRRTDPSQKGWKYHYHSYKNNTNARTLGFDLTIDQFRDICSQDCFYCGQPPSLEITGAYESAKRTSIRNQTRFHEDFYQQTKILANGIDRVDSERGYQISNIVPCCSICNYAKSNLSQQDFFVWIKRVYNFSMLEVV